MSGLSLMGPSWRPPAGAAEGISLESMAVDIAYRSGKAGIRQPAVVPWLTIGLLSLAAAALGPALLGKVRLYEERSLWWLGGACILALAAAMLSGVKWGGKGLAVAMMGAGLVLNFWVLLTER